MSKEELLNNPLVKKIVFDYVDSINFTTKSKDQIWENFVKVQTKKDWTILSYQHLAPGGYNWTRRKDNLFRKAYDNDKGGIAHPEEFFSVEHQKNYSISSVRRESDGEVFTVGDKISCQQYPKEVREITDFSLNNNEIEVNDGIDEYTFKLSEIFKAKQKLFTTEDGVDIYEGGEAWHITTKYGNLNDLAKIAFNNFRQQEALHNIGLFFSTKEKAEEYIVMNKPCLSINDVNKCWQYYEVKGTRYIHGSNTLKKIINLIKNKLKLNE